MTEFTGLDLEMAFVSWGEKQNGVSAPADQDWRIRGPDTARWRIGGTEVRDVVEGLIRKVWRDVEGVELPGEFPVMTYDEAMSRVRANPFILLFSCFSHNISVNGPHVTSSDPTNRTFASGWRWVLSINIWRSARVF